MRGALHNQQKFWQNMKHYTRRPFRRYRGIIETQSSKARQVQERLVWTLEHKSHVIPKVGHELVSEGVGVLLWHAALVAVNVLWKPHTIRQKVEFGNKVQLSIGVASINWGVTVYDHNQDCHEKKKEIWLSPMTTAPTPTEKSKKQRKTLKRGDFILC